MGLKDKIAKYFGYKIADEITIKAVDSYNSVKNNPNKVISILSALADLLGRPLSSTTKEEIKNAWSEESDKDLDKPKSTE